MINHQLLKRNADSNSNNNNSNGPINMQLVKSEYNNNNTNNNNNNYNFMNSNSFFDSTKNRSNIKVENQEFNNNNGFSFGKSSDYQNPAAPKYPRGVIKSEDIVKREHEIAFSANRKSVVEWDQSPVKTNSPKYSSPASPSKRVVFEARIKAPLFSDSSSF